MSRITGSLSLNPADPAPDEPTLNRLAACLTRPGFGRALVGRHGRLAVAISAAKSNGAAAAERCQATDAGRRLVVYLDGLLFNRSELLHELRAEHRLEDDASSAQLVLAAYATWGDACFGRLSGIFAVVLQDEAAGRCLLVRDPFGAKFLHYAEAAGRLWFSSEFGPLRALRGDARVNSRALLEFILHGDVLPPDSLFDGLQTVPHGSWLEADASTGRTRLRRYCDAFDCVDQANHHRLERDGAARFLEELDGHLHRSIRAHMAEGGPFAVALSGGVDSAVLTAIAARYGDIQLINVSVPQGRKLDERRMAEAVGRHVGVPVSVVTMSDDLYRRELVAATLANEMPLWHVQNVGFYLASRRASELGARALLCGDTIGMMLSPSTQLPWWKLQPLVSALGRGPRALPAFVRKLGHALAGLPLDSAGFSWAAPLGIQLLDGYARSELQRRAEEKYSFERSAVRRRVFGGRLADVYLQHSRFHYRGDRLGNASAVEYRSPFGDLESLKLSMNLPYDYLVRDGVSKWSIKALGQRYIPREIAFQKKVAWNMPMDIYFRPFATPEFFVDGFCAQALGLTAAAIRARLPAWTENAHQLARLVHAEIWGRLFAFGHSRERVESGIARLRAAAAT